MRVLIVYILVLITVSFAFSQKERKYIRSGNTNYTTEDYSTAESEYAKAMNENSYSFEAGFNYGDALFRQEKYDEAEKQFENLAYSETTKDNKAKAFHNLGNTYFKKYASANPQEKEEILKKSIDAYKNSLRNNPSDSDTKYNLAYTQKMLKKMQEQQKNQDKDKKDDKKEEDKEDQEKKDQDKKDQEKKDQQKKEDNKDEQEQQPKEKKQEMSKQEAAQMLKASENDEKKTQKKLQKKKVKGQEIKIEKDW